MRKMIEVNFVGTANGMKLAIPRMRARGGGHIVNVVSAGAFVAAPHESSYAATKHAVKGLCDGPADRAARHRHRAVADLPRRRPDRARGWDEPGRGGQLRRARGGRRGDRRLRRASRAPRCSCRAAWRRCCACTRRCPSRGRMAMQKAFGVDGSRWTRTSPSARSTSGGWLSADSALYPGSAHCRLPELVAQSVTSCKRPQIPIFPPEPTSRTHGCDRGKAGRNVQQH